MEYLGMMGIITADCFHIVTSTTGNNGYLHIVRKADRTHPESAMRDFFVLFSQLSCTCEIITKYSLKKNYCFIFLLFNFISM